MLWKIIQKVASKIYNWLSIHKRSPPKLLTTKDVKVEVLEVEEGVKLKGVNGARTFEL